MRHIFFRLWALLLVEGVSGDEKVTVMEGDSVTLKDGGSEVQTGDLIVWKFNDFIIMKILKTAEVFTSNDVLDERFRGRLKLDQTGSLTITNIRTTDSGLYKLNIRSSKEVSKEYSVTVSDVFSVDSDGVKSVSVMEGDSVTLHTGVTQKQRDDVIQWKFGDQDLNGWSNVNDLTEGITIRNIRRDQSGVYEVEINTRRLILHRKLRINISGEMNTVSVMEGEPSILFSGVIEIQGYDLILWKFEDHLIAEINKVANRFLTLDSSAGGRFKGRLQLHRQSGSLTVRGSRTTDSGDYHLHMNSSSHTLQRSISVTVSAVPDPGLSAGAVAGIVAAVLLVVFAAVIIAVVIYHRRKISELQSCRARKSKVCSGWTNTML